VVAGEVRVHAVSRAQLAQGLGLAEALVAAGLASSKADARRGLQGGGYSLNGERLDAERSLGPGDLLADRYVVLQKGKKNYAMLELQ
ncbi:MAG TPA: hypothetical protein VIP80_00990, partial [Gemmatimonadales bacterium]